MPRKNLLFTAGLWLSVFGLFVFLTLNKHSRSGFYNYHSEIWGDKAGYYIYLPATFIYHFNPALLPDSIVQKTGNGFVPEPLNGSIRTKYSCGVAVMQMPFFLASHVLSPVLGYSADGFSPPYHRSVDIAAVFYLVLGMFILFRLLKERINSLSAALLLITMVLGTNLYYYAIDETGMSHMYSFALFATFLLLMQKTAYLRRAGLSMKVLTGILCGMIILVRPTNALIFSVYFFMDIRNRDELVQRIKYLFHVSTLLPLLLSILIVLTPQLLYWKYTYGQWFYYSYGNEGFNWLDPKPFLSWFSPKNGLFVYTPLYFLLILSWIRMRKNNYNNFLFISLLFLLLTYIVSSWYDWAFGCALGGRSYVEYLAILCIPLGYLIQDALHSRIHIRLVFFSILTLCILHNLKFTYSYDGCFPGIGNWDWQASKEILLSPTK